MGTYYLSEKLSQMLVTEHLCAQGTVLSSLSVTRTPTVIYAGKSPLSLKLLLSQDVNRNRQKYACIV